MMLFVRVVRIFGLFLVWFVVSVMLDLCLLKRFQWRLIAVASWFEVRVIFVLEMRHFRPMLFNSTTETPGDQPPNLWGRSRNSYPNVSAPRQRASYNLIEKQCCKHPHCYHGAIGRATTSISATAIAASALTSIFATTHGKGGFKNQLWLQRFDTSKCWVGKCWVLCQLRPQRM